MIIVTIESDKQGEGKSALANFIAENASKIKGVGFNKIRVVDEEFSSHLSKNELKKFQETLKKQNPDILVRVLSSGYLKVT